MWYSTTVTIAFVFPFVLPFVLPFVVAVVPVPLTLTVCGLPTPLLVTVITLLRGPGALGLNVTPNAQVAPAAKVPQELLAHRKFTAGACHAGNVDSGAANVEDVYRLRGARRVDGGVRQ